MSNEVIETEASDVGTHVAEGSPAPLVVLAGADDTLCIDDMCVASEVRA